MSAASDRRDAGAAVAGLFDRATATGGLARRERVTAALDAPESGRRSSSEDSSIEPRVRLGVEMTERDVEFLRSMSRPARTGGPRTLGGKFVATGVLIAAIELLRSAEVEMHGVVAGDLDAMSGRARAALVRAAAGSYR